MPASMFASLRPLNRRCLHHAESAILSLNLKSRTGTIQLRALVPLHIRHSQRYQSNLRTTKDQNGRPRQQQITFGQFLRRALAAGFRNLAYTVSPTGIRSAYREYSASTVMMILLFVGFTATCSVVLTRFYKAFYSDNISNYPKPVADTLRRALMHAFYRPDPELALKFFKRAMRECDELGLDPFSDEVLGIRIMISLWLERIEHFKNAIDVLEQLLGDCQKWVNVFEQTVKDGKVTPEGRLIENVIAETEQQKEKGSGPDQSGSISTVPTSPSETLWFKRQRILSKAISTSVKLGELYACEYVMEPEKAHPHLLWAVETSLKEMQRRRQDGLRPGEGKTFMTREELGGSLESLGRDYERRSQFQFAIPLFFQALKMCESPCHRAVIMNNLSASFAQQPELTPVTTDVSGALTQLFAEPLPANRKESLEAALNWSKNAYGHANDVKGDDRTPECDEACAVALCNWGDVAAMMGKADVAAKQYRRCIELSSKMDFPDGTRQAQEGLARLKQTS